MSERNRRSRSPRRRRRHSQSRSRSRSRSESHSASSKHSRHHKHRHYERKSRRHEGAEKEKLENREEVAHRSRMWTVVDSDSDDASSINSERKKPRDASPDSRHGLHRSRRRLRSSSDSDSETSDSSESERLLHKKKRKHESSRKDKKRHKKKHKKKKDGKSKKHAVDQDQYGKYGILRESDFHSKSVSFQAWLRDVKKMGEFNGPKWEAMELFKEYMEDYNTCTLPHEKYYDVEKYEMRRYQKQQRKAHTKKNDASKKAPSTLADEEQVRRERLDAREKKEQEEFRLVLQLMDKDKIDAMREQERLRAQMQLFYKSGNVEEARRLEKILNKEEEDLRFKR